MIFRESMNRMAISALLATLVMLGCSGEKPELMVASARNYIARNDNKAAVIELKNALQISPNLGEARFLLGQVLLDSGNPTLAEVELLKAVELKYPPEQVAPVLARSLLMQGKFEKIINDFSSVRLVTPGSNADLQTSVAQANLMSGKIGAAQAAFTDALAAVSDYGPALIGEARIKAKNRDLPGAMAQLGLVLEKFPGLYEAWQLKGDILTAQDDLKGSMDAYRQALAVRSDYLPAHSSLVSRLLTAGNLEEAGRQLAAMKEIAPVHPQTHYLQAQLTYQQKDYKAAQQAIQHHLRMLPDSVLGLQLAGIIEYELKAYSTAETYLLKVLPRTPELGFPRIVLISSYLRDGQPGKALALLQPVLAKIEKNSNMLALAGEVYMQNGDTEKAATYYARAAALDPMDNGKRTSFALAQLVLGEADNANRELEKIALIDTGVRADLALIASHFNGRQFDQALKAIAALEKKQPENPLVYNLRGTAYLGKGDRAGARAGFEQALLKRPAYFPALANLANLNLVEKKPEAAKALFEAVVAKDPKDVQALLALAELRAKTGGKPDEVAALINQAVALNPLDAGPRTVLIRQLMASGDFKKAAAVAQDALAVMPDQPDILNAAGRAQAAAGDLNQALSTYTRLTSLMPNSPEPYLRMAEIQLAAKNKEAARQSYGKALSVKTDSIDARRGIVMLDLDAGRTAEALASARQIQKQYPKDAVGHVMEGDIQASRKSWKEATAAFRKAIRLNAASELAIKLHAALSAGGEVGEAGLFADRWLKEHAGEIRFRHYLADAANAREDYAAARKQYRVLIELQPNNPATLNNLAWTLSQIKDPKALDYAENAYRLAPDQPAINDTLGGILVENGDFSRGLTLLQKAVDLDPKNPQIRFHLAKALLKSGKPREAKNELDELARLGEKFPAQAEVEKLLRDLRNS